MCKLRIVGSWYCHFYRAASLQFATHIITYDYHLWFISAKDIDTHDVTMVQSD